MKSPFIWRYFRMQCAYRRQYEPPRIARVNAARATIYTWRRGLIDWLEPPTATSWEWRMHGRREAPHP
jgi:hypothetical protein